MIRLVVLRVVLCLIGFGANQVRLNTAPGSFLNVVAWIVIVVASIALIHAIIFGLILRFQPQKRPPQFDDRR